MRRGTAIAAAAVLALGLAACGDDEDDTDEEGAAADDGGTAAGGDNAAFCDALVEFNSMAVNLELHEGSSEEEIKAAGEEIAPVFQTVADNAPEELADTAAELNESVQALLEGDSEPFNSDDTFMTYTEMAGQAVDACGFESIEVTGVDYAFEGVPATVPAGTVAFEFVNESDSEEHEMILVKKAAGVQLSWEELVELPEEESESMVEFAGATFAPPGGSSSTFAELSPGEYAMLCFIPVGGAEDGPPHFTQGMLQELTVE
ncbi:MAG: hypothetical protein ACLGI8_07715 [Acidimicrobiia bacterium]